MKWQMLKVSPVIIIRLKYNVSFPIRKLPVIVSQLVCVVFLKRKPGVRKRWLNLRIVFLLLLSAGYQKDDGKLESPRDLLIALVRVYSLASYIGPHSSIPFQFPGSLRWALLAAISSIPTSLPPASLDLSQPCTRALSHFTNPPSLSQAQRPSSLFV